MAKPKYKLVSAVSDSPKLCAFFATEEGCRNGTNCKFLHELPVMTQCAPVPSAESSSVVSSESGDEEQDTQLFKSPDSDNSKDDNGKNTCSKTPAKANLSKSNKKALKVTQEQEQDQQNLLNVIQRQQEELDQLRNQMKAEKLKAKQKSQQEEIEKIRKQITEEKLIVRQTETQTSKKKSKKRKNSNESVFASPPSISKKIQEVAKQDSSELSSEESNEETSSQDVHEEGCSVSIFKNMAHNIPCADDKLTNDYLNQSLGPKYFKELQNSSNKSDDSNDDVADKTETRKNTLNFRNLNLPVAPFSIEKKSVTNPPSKSPSKQKKLNEFGEIIIPNPTPLKFPDAFTFIPLLQATREHPRYKSSYNISKYKQAESFSRDSWIKTRPYGDWCKDNPAIIAIDCEMCQSKDPLSGNVNNKELCRISVVNGIDTSDVLLDTLVKPKWPVIDYREDINGINKEDMKDVHFTLEHAQAFMQALCCEETIIVGHAVFNDLVALKLEHYCNVDSAFLFRVEGDESIDGGSMPALKDCATCILGKEMSKLHDSVNDAIVSLDCCKSYLDKKGQVDKVVRTPRRKRSSVIRTEKSSEKKAYGNECLFVHRLPLKGCNGRDISALFVLYSKIKPVEVEKIEFGSKHGKTYVRFPDEKTADLAFASIEAKKEKDKSGKSQKRVFMRDGNYIHIRQMKK